MKMYTVLALETVALVFMQPNATKHRAPYCTWHENDRLWPEIVAFVMLS